MKHWIDALKEIADLLGEDSALDRACGAWAQLNAPGKEIEATRALLSLRKKVAQLSHEISETSDQLAERIQGMEQKIERRLKQDEKEHEDAMRRTALRDAKCHMSLSRLQWSPHAIQSDAFIATTPFVGVRGYRLQYLMRLAEPTMEGWAVFWHREGESSWCPFFLRTVTAKHAMSVAEAHAFDMGAMGDVPRNTENDNDIEEQLLDSPWIWHRTQECPRRYETQLDAKRSYLLLRGENTPSWRPYYMRQNDSAPTTLIPLGDNVIDGMDLWSALNEVTEHYNEEEAQACQSE